MTLTSIVGLGFVAVITVGVLLFAFSSQRKLPAEKGLVPLYSARGTASTRGGFGLRFGTNMPTCRITLYERAVVMAIGPPVLVAYEDIEKVKCERSWCANRLEVSMRNSSLVWNFNVRSPEKVAGIFKEKGVRIIGF